MESDLLKYIGIPPGAIIERALLERSIKIDSFAISIDEISEELNMIIKGKQDISSTLASKIEKALDWEEGIIITLQNQYKSEKDRIRTQATPNLSILRKSLFWDTKIENIDWDNYYRAVISRVFERGNEEEKNEIIRFYGIEKVNTIISEKYF